MSDQKVRIVVAQPSKDEPGYLRRALQAADFAEAVQQKKITREMMYQMVDFLLAYVKEPMDRKEAREALMDASEAQFDDLLAIVGGSSSSTVPLASGSPSSAITSPT